MSDPCQFADMCQTRRLSLAEYHRAALEVVCQRCRELDAQLAALDDVLSRIAHGPPSEVRAALADGIAIIVQARRALAQKEERRE